MERLGDGLLRRVALAFGVLHDVDEARRAYRLRHGRAPRSPPGGCPVVTRVVDVSDERPLVLLRSPRAGGPSTRSPPACGAYGNLGREERPVSVAVADDHDPAASPRPGGCGHELVTRPRGPRAGAVPVDSHGSGRRAGTGAHPPRPCPARAGCCARVAAEGPAEQPEPRHQGHGADLREGPGCFGARAQPPRADTRARRRLFRDARMFEAQALVSPAPHPGRGAAPRRGSGGGTQRAVREHRQEELLHAAGCA